MYLKSREHSTKRKTHTYTYINQKHRILDSSSSIHLASPLTIETISKNNSGVEITVVNGTIAIVANEGTIIETISKNSCNCVFSNCVHSSNGGGGNRNKPPPPPHTYTHNGQVKLSYPAGFISDQELDFALSNPPACVVAAVGKYEGDLAVWFDEHGHYGLDDWTYADKNDDLFEMDGRTGIWKKTGKFDVKNHIENPPY